MEVCLASVQVEFAVEDFEPATSADFDAIFRLLSDSSLPVADLEDHVSAFTLAKLEGTIVGTVGVEIYGEVALLRSLCVAPAHRSKRIGAELVSVAASHALASGVRELYLLTTSASPYFANLGFAHVQRDRVPLAIRNTAQFSALCPSSAVCMCRMIGLEAAASPSGTPGASARKKTSGGC
jgi:amino-acid N-acetyltransferase